MQTLRWWISAAALAVTAAASGASARVMDAGGEVRAPRILASAAPEFARCATSGTRRFHLVAQVIVGIDGRAQDVQFVKRADVCFEQAARDAIRRWRFAPGTYRGKPVPVRFTIAITPSVH